MLPDFGVEDVGLRLVYRVEEPLRVISRALLVDGMRSAHTLCNLVHPFRGRNPVFSGDVLFVQFLDVSQPYAFLYPDYFVQSPVITQFRRDNPLHVFNCFRLESHFLRLVVQRLDQFHEIRLRSAAQLERLDGHARHEHRVCGGIVIPVVQSVLAFVQSLSYAFAQDAGIVFGVQLAFGLLQPSHFL